MMAIVSSVAGGVAGGAASVQAGEPSRAPAVDPAPASWWNIDDIKSRLAGPGLEGEVHAVRAEESLFVFTLRNPANFFEFVHISLVPINAPIQEKLAVLHRHDRVRLKGAILENKSPQIHVEVSGVELVRAYDPGREIPPYDYEVTLPEGLPQDEAGNGDALFLVHAIHGEGKILVVEYKDAVIPIYVPNGALAKDLYRNDIIRLRYRVRKDPAQPTHLRLRNDVEKPLELVESALSKHGLPADLTGALVLFPKSPQVSIDVFALHEVVEGGATRQYTLANFDSPEVFKAIRQKCTTAWAQDPGNFVNGRNKLIHRKVRVRAKGMFNVVDPNQANVQILLKSADDLEFFTE
jgi:hypothetical protein